MIPVNLTETVQLFVEPAEKKVRLVVMKNGAEWVCRKESYYKLDRFLKSGSGRLFQGRLQLNLVTGNVEVEVKGVTVGVIPMNDFRQRLLKLKEAFKSEVKKVS